MRGPGLAEASDFAAHQARQWARWLSVFGADAVVFGLICGAFSVANTFEDGTSLVDATVYGAVSMVAELGPSMRLPGLDAPAGVERGLLFDVFDEGIELL